MPWYSGRQVQAPSLQTVFGPQGDGLQRSCGMGAKKIVLYWNISILIGYCNRLHSLLEWEFLTWWWWWSGITIAERIACVSFRTRAHWCMINDSAQCTWAARAWAWISAFFVHASAIARTVGIYRTLGTTIGRRTDVIVDTSTARSLADWAANWIGTAGRWIARILRFSLWYTRCWENRLFKKTWYIG